ncbi:MAG: septal ring lytic transglycosylase RlpA family protein [Goleter apudmare HA4340-LM2]|jgi:rare lipoprotein A|nr:septal ring lytic transglycosylase RlpA family protein [Goleter apudmare HA4340-LM2]
MLIFGILWITSWVGSFLSLSDNLSSNLTVKMTPTEVTSNLGKNVLGTTLIPTRFLKIDWGTKKSLTDSDKPLKSRAKAVKNTTNQLCHYFPENVEAQATFTRTSFLASAALINTSTPNRDFFPNKILRSLQDFFRFHSPVEQSFSVATSPVAVVRRSPNNYELWVNKQVVANLPNETKAKSMQQRLQQLVRSPNLDADQLRPALVDGIPALMAGNRFLFGIEKQISRQYGRSGDLLAIEWINNLRSALKAPTLTLLEGQKEMYGLSPSKTKMSGLASWYGGYFHGRLTANGEIYNQNDLTVAHKSLPFNTYLQVTNLKTGKAVIVRVNDRGPYIPPRSLDLSLAAARCINSEIAGVVPYKAVILNSKAPKMTLKTTNLATDKLKPGRKIALVSEF